jgi:hypothetical protein
MAEVPLPNGADVNVVAKRQCTSVDWAAIKARPELVELLVTHGAIKPAPALSTPSVAPELHERVRHVPVGKRVLARVLDGMESRSTDYPR